MGTALTGFLEMSLVFGTILLLAIYELVSLRRSQRRDEQQRAQEEVERGKN